MTLGLCSQIELDALIAKASEKRRKMDAEAGEDGPSLAPIEAEKPEEDEAEVSASSKELTAENLFNLGNKD